MASTLVPTTGTPDTAGATGTPNASHAAPAPRPRLALHPTEIDWAAVRREYPESDGKPMADKTKQFRYIQTIAGGIDALFRDDPDVFVAGDLFWYPVEGHKEICQAPDVLVVFGRPKGDRGSYVQVLEGDIAPQVVFEVRSPRNTAPEMARKRAFYERYGAEEYYDYDPDRGVLRGWVRRGEALAAIEEVQGWVSPRLEVRFELEDGELRLYRLDGQRFVSYAELDAQRAQADQRAAQVEGQAAQDRQRAERLAARLRALGIDPEAE
jgi:Uma2 family endonuclease